MGLREKVALKIIAIIFFQIAHQNCLPRSFRKPNLKEIFKSNIIKSDRNGPSIPIYRRSPIQNEYKRVSDLHRESIYEKFNFPEIEYPVAATPRLPFYFKKSNLESSRPLINKHLPLNRSPFYTPKLIDFNTQDIPRRKYGIANLGQFVPTGNLHDLEPTSQYNSFRDLGGFPEIEFPTKAIDTWKPNYWINAGRASDLEKNEADNGNRNFDEHKNIFTKLHNDLNSLKYGKDNYNIPKSDNNLSRQRNRISEKINVDQQTTINEDKNDNEHLLEEIDNKIEIGSYGINKPQPKTEPNIIDNYPIIPTIEKLVPKKNVIVNNTTSENNPVIGLNNIQDFITKHQLISPYDGINISNVSKSSGKGSTSMSKSDNIYDKNKILLVQTPKTVPDSIIYTNNITLVKENTFNITEKKTSPKTKNNNEKLFNDSKTSNRMLPISTESFTIPFFNNKLVNDKSSIENTTKMEFSERLNSKTNISETEKNILLTNTGNLDLKNLVLPNIKTENSSKLNNDVKLENISSTISFLQVIDKSPSIQSVPLSITNTPYIEQKESVTDTSSSDNNYYLSTENTTLLDVDSTKTFLDDMLPPTNFSLFYTVNTPTPTDATTRAIENVSPIFNSIYVTYDTEALSKINDSIPYRGNKSTIINTYYDENASPLVNTITAPNSHLFKEFISNTDYTSPVTDIAISITSIFTDNPIVDEEAPIIYNTTASSISPMNVFSITSRPEDTPPNAEFRQFNSLLSLNQNNHTLSNTTFRVNESHIISSSLTLENSSVTTDNILFFTPEVYTESTHVDYTLHAEFLPFAYKKKSKLQPISSYIINKTALMEDTVISNTFSSITPSDKSMKLIENLSKITHNTAVPTEDTHEICDMTLATTSSTDNIISKKSFLENGFNIDILEDVKSLQFADKNFNFVSVTTMPTENVHLSKNETNFVSSFPEITSFDKYLSVLSEYIPHFTEYTTVLPPEYIENESHVETSPNFQTTVSLKTHFSTKMPEAAFTADIPICSDNTAVNDKLSLYSNDIVPCTVNMLVPTESTSHSNYIPEAIDSATIKLPLCGINTLSVINAPPAHSPIGHETTTSGITHSTISDLQSYDTANLILTTDATKSFTSIIEETNSTPFETQILFSDNKILPVEKTLHPKYDTNVGLYTPTLNNDSTSCDNLLSTTILPFTEDVPLIDEYLTYLEYLPQENDSISFKKNIPFNFRDKFNDEILKSATISINKNMSTKDLQQLDENNLPDITDCANSIEHIDNTTPFSRLISEHSGNISFKPTSHIPQQNYLKKNKLITSNNIILSTDNSSLLMEYVENIPKISENISSDTNKIKLKERIPLILTLLHKNINTPAPTVYKSDAKYSPIKTNVNSIEEITKYLDDPSSIEKPPFLNEYPSRLSKMSDANILSYPSITPTFTSTENDLQTNNIPALIDNRSFMYDSPLNTDDITSTGYIQPQVDGSYLTTQTSQVTEGTPSFTPLLLEVTPDIEFSTTMIHTLHTDEKRLPSINHVFPRKDIPQYTPNNIKLLIEDLTISDPSESTTLLSDYYTNPYMADTLRLNDNLIQKPVVKLPDSLTSFIEKSHPYTHFDMQLVTDETRDFPEMTTSRLNIRRVEDYSIDSKNTRMIENVSKLSNDFEMLVNCTSQPIDSFTLPSVKKSFETFYTTPHEYSYYNTNKPLRTYIIGDELHLYPFYSQEETKDTYDFTTKICSSSFESIDNELEADSNVVKTKDNDDDENNKVFLNTDINIVSTPYPSLLYPSYFITTVPTYEFTEKTTPINKEIIYADLDSKISPYSTITPDLTLNFDANEKIQVSSDDISTITENNFKEFSSSDSPVFTTFTSYFESTPDPAYSNIFCNIPLFNSSFTSPVDVVDDINILDSSFKTMTSSTPNSLTDLNTVFSDTASYTTSTNLNINYIPNESLTTSCDEKIRMEYIEPINSDIINTEDGTQTPSTDFYTYESTYPHKYSPSIQEISLSTKISSTTMSLGNCEDPTFLSDENIINDTTSTPPYFKRDTDISHCLTSPASYKNTNSFSKSSISSEVTVSTPSHFEIIDASQLDTGDSYFKPYIDNHIKTTGYPDSDVTNLSYTITTDLNYTNSNFDSTRDTATESTYSGLTQIDQSTSDTTLWSDDDIYTSFSHDLTARDIFPSYTTSDFGYEPISLTSPLVLKLLPQVDNQGKSPSHNDIEYSWLEYLDSSANSEVYSETTSLYKEEDIKPFYYEPIYFTTPKQKSESPTKSDAIFKNESVTNDPKSDYSFTLSAANETTLSSYNDNSTLHYNASNKSYDENIVNLTKLYTSTHTPESENYINKNTFLYPKYILRSESSESLCTSPTSYSETTTDSSISRFNEDINIIEPFTITSSLFWSTTEESVSNNKVVNEVVTTTNKYTDISSFDKNKSFEKKFTDKAPLPYILMTKNSNIDDIFDQSSEEIGNAYVKYIVGSMQHSYIVKVPVNKNKKKSKTKKYSQH